ncbi:MAG TPA: PilZ domain-containing protein [Polyangiales bacterium]
MSLTRLAQVRADNNIELQDSAPIALERLTCPRQIHELLDFLAREQVPGQVETSAGPRDTRICLVDGLGLHFQGETADWRLPTSVSFLHLNTLYQVPVAPRADGAAALPTPAWIGKLARRRARRAQAPAELSLVLRNRSPNDSPQPLKLHDLSRTGLSFRVPQPAQPFRVGATLDFGLLLSGQERGSYRGSVRNVRTADDGADVVIGLSFERLSPQEQLALSTLLDTVLYPSTLGRARDVWNVFERSGYLHLSGKAPRDFDPLRAPFLRVARALEGAPEVGTIAHWPNKGSIQATVSHLKVYQSSWLLCQVSKAKAEGISADGRRGLWEMYLRIYEGAQSDKDTRWLLVYVQDSAPRWSRELHVELPRRFLASGDACLLPFRALEIRVDAGLRARAEEAAGVRVVRADYATACGAVRDLSRVRPAQYLDALDLTEARFALDGVRLCWERAGLERERQLLVAYEGDVRCALAVVETAEVGCHLYGLLDCLRMYPLRPGGERAFGSLLREAQRWFAARKRDSFVYLEEFPSALPVPDHAVRNLGGASLSILAVERMPELLQRTSDLVSERPPAKAS